MGGKHAGIVAGRVTESALIHACRSGRALRRGGIPENDRAPISHRFIGGQREGYIVRLLAGVAIVTDDIDNHAGWALPLNKSRLHDQIQTKQA